VVFYWKRDAIEDWGSTLVAEKVVHASRHPTTSRAPIKHLVSNATGSGSRRMWAASLVGVNPTTLALRFIK